MDNLNLPPVEDTLSQLDSPAPEPAAPAADPAAPAAPIADDLWEVKVNGKTFKVPREELVAGYQRQQDYTRKTTQLAEERRALEKIQSEHRQFLSEREQLKQFLQDKAAIQEYLRQLDGQADPNDPAGSPVTAAHLQRMAAMQQKALEQRMAQMTAELEIRQTAASYATEIDNVIKATLAQHPELKSVRRIDRILREEVAERQPGNIEEAKQLFSLVAKEQADALRAFAAEEKKKAAASHAQLSNGIEPPGGAGLQPSPTRFSLGDPRLRQAFEDALKDPNIS